MMRHKLDGTLLILLGLIFSLVNLGTANAESATPPLPTPGPLPFFPEAAQKSSWDSDFPRSLVATSFFTNPDLFGYHWDDSPALAWIDATAGTKLSFPSSDDSFAGPVDVGFSFRFYENSYTQVYVSTNGFLTFGEGNTSARSESILKETPPNNVIAPFWDDLVVGAPSNSGQVFALKGGTAPQRYLVVEWRDVTRLFQEEGELDPLTFQVQLYENGDIFFQYKTLNGVVDQAAVGIKDKDGIDGLLYLYQQAGLTSGTSVRITRPPAGPRAKVLPLYRSGFAVNRQVALNFTVRNSGESGEDVYDLSTLSSSPGWTATLFAGNTPLTDSDQDGVVDTGKLAQGASLVVTARVQAPVGAGVGDSTHITLTARSSKEPARQAVMTLQAAIPASFAQVYVDSDIPTGMRLHLVRSANIITTKVEDWFSGSNLAVASALDGNYVYAWEKNGTNVVGGATIHFSDVEYIVLSRSGVVVHPGTKLTNNSTVTQFTFDHYPHLAVLPSGKIGVLWIRDLVDMTKGINSNVYFALLDSGGDLAKEPLNLTKNTAWRGAGNVPFFTSPRLTATQDNRFVLAWVQESELTAGEKNDIWVAVLDANAGQIKAPFAFAQSTPGSNLYIDPNLSSLTGNRVFLAYTSKVASEQSYQVMFSVLNSSGDAVQPQTKLAGAAGRGTDAYQLTSGKVIVAWNNLSTGKIAYALLNDQSFSTASAPADLTNPNKRISGNVSVTGDPNGNAIMTWMDVEWNYFLYYALVGSDGSLLTEPLVFYTGQAGQPSTQTSFAGQGNAPYAGDASQIYLPLVQR